MARAVVPGLVAALAALAACGRAPADAPRCGAVGATFLALATHDLTRRKLDETMQRAVTDQLPAMRDSLVHACTESKWGAAVRTCLVQARDHLAFEACELQLTEAQRGALDRAARGETGSR